MLLGKSREWVKIAGRIASYFLAGQPSCRAVGFDTFLNRHLVLVRAERLLTVKPLAAP